MIPLLRALNARRDKRLRDEFAMAAMSALIASNEYKLNKAIGPVAYMVADTMMTARKPTNTRDNNNE